MSRSHSEALAGAAKTCLTQIYRLLSTESSLQKSVEGAQEWFSVPSSSFGRGGPMRVKG